MLNSILKILVLIGFLSFPSPFVLALEPDLELWPGPARAGAMRAYILGVSNTFSSLPSTVSANVLGIDYGFREGDLIEVSDDTTTTFYVLSVMSGQKEWVQIFDALGAGQVLQATREKFLTTRTSWVHYFPPGKRLSPTTPVDLTIGGAPYQREGVDYAVLPGATPGSHGGVLVELTSGVWEAGAVAEMVYSLVTSYASPASLDLSGIDKDFTSTVWKAWPEEYHGNAVSWTEHNYNSPRIGSSLRYNSFTLNHFSADHRIVAASLDGEPALVGAWNPGDSTIRVEYTNPPRSGRVWLEIDAPDYSKLLTGGSSLYTFPHYASSTDGLWVVVRRESDGAYIVPSIEVDDTYITLEFASPPTSGELRAIWKEGMYSNGYRF